MFEQLLEDAMCLSDDEVDAAIRELELGDRARNAQRAALLAVAAQRGTYRDDGHRSITGYLRATCNVSSREASRRRLIAEVCNTVPALGDALAAGRVGETQLVEIARIHTNPRTREFFGRVAPIFVELAEHSSHDDLRDRIGSFLNLADQDGSFVELCNLIEHRTATVTTIGGSLDIRATGGDPLVADEVVAIFDWFVEREFTADADARRTEHGDTAAQHPLARSDRQRRFDALVAMARAAAAHGDGTKPADITTNIIADADTFDETLTGAGIITERADEVVEGDFDGDTTDRLIADAADDPTRWIGRRCETSRGTPIHPVLLLQALMRGHVRRVLVDQHQTVVDWGRQRRLFTGPARQAARLLTRRCTHPGCTIPAGLCDIDHNTEWAHGGTTDQANANIECRTHNRHKSQARWHTVRDRHGRTFHIRPDGTLILPVGARQPHLDQAA